MTVSLDADTIILSGACGVEEVETLVGYLEDKSVTSVDLGAATVIHTALWQALIAFRVNMVASPVSSSTVERILVGLNASPLENRDD